MASTYEHLRIEKEPLVNPRRKGGGGAGSITRADPRQHAKGLREQLDLALEAARTQPGAEDGRIVLKLKYAGSLRFENLQKHGVQLLSQEDKSVCVVFASEQGLAEFSDHLAKLGRGEDDELTYKDILLALEAIGGWSREDRESWAIRQFGLPSDERFMLDVELWPVAPARGAERVQTIESFERWIAVREIRRIDCINRDSLLLFRLEVSHSQADELFNHRDVRFIDLPPRTGINYRQLDSDASFPFEDIPPPALDAARVCILDSGVNGNHRLLKSAFGEAASYVAGEDASDGAGHGTAVAGIALYGDLEACVESRHFRPEFWLYSGKVMTKSPNGDDAVFDHRTIEGQIEEAVEYFAGELGCRVFNVSLGNENAPYDDRHIRGIAYTLDRLARDYGVLFIVSAGNFRGTDTLPRNDWRAEYPDYLLAPESVIIDPAPALNVLTVGALAKHTATANEQHYGDREVNELSPAAEGQPAPFTRHGPSLKGAFKPELVAHGGNLACPIRREGEQWKNINRHLGVLTLNHQPIGATLLKSISGTSFAAPYVTHLAGRLLNLYPKSSANLLRALLCNRAVLPEACSAVFPEPLKDRVRDVAGYGMVDEDILFRSTEEEVVLMAEDAIRNESHQFYELPLPASFLESRRATRYLRVSLAFCPPVRTTRLDYTATKISFRLVKGRSLEQVQRSFNQNHKKEVDSMPDATRSNRDITSQQREKGTVQASCWRLKQLRPTHKWFVVVTRQDKEWGGALCDEAEPYALVVSVSDRENEQVRLYTEIKQRIREQAEARLRARV